MARPRRANERPASSLDEIRSRSPLERLAALEDEHERLLRAIAQKKQQLQGLVGEVDRVGRELAIKLAPLRDQLAALSNEVHELFAGLLGHGQLSRQAHKQVAEVYRFLQVDGAILPSEDPAPEPPMAGVGASSARRPGGPAPAGSLRDLYRRLARAVHPDKVQDEDEKARRTEAMKEVTRAYGDGDLARLLELERSLRASGHGTAHADDLEQRCRALEHTNQELRAQLAVLAREIAGLRRSPQGAMAKELRRGAAGADPITAVVEGAHVDIARLRELRDFVRSFSTKQISLARFLKGPPASRQRPDPSMDEDPTAEIMAMLAIMEALGAAADPSSRKKHRSRRTRSASKASDIPF